MAGLYVHIPFCAKRCIYCDFYSNTDMGYKEACMDALLCEMDVRRDYLQGETVETIYLGGGTPSQLSPQDLEKLLNGVFRVFSVSDNPEITLEANPDDLSDGYISALTHLPFNRISIGIQSFDDRELRLLNRRHTAQEAFRAVTRCKDAGLTNISIDLMYGLPEQTTEIWQHNINKAIELDVSHISAYNLTYEEETVIYKMMECGKLKPVEDELCEQFFRILIEKLTTAGFVHYEISNFAKRSDSYPDGRISLHNSSYWNGTRYLGFGPSAHSYNGKCRSWNISSISAYIRAVSDGSGEFYETEVLDERARYNDFIITRLRTMWGVSLDELRREFGKEREHYFLEKSEAFMRLNMLKVKDNFVKVTSEGIFVSDAIMRELIAL
ncbi:MAG: radical SAM family heme chaperone HemW [Tannerella sp.]|jgi:oxygen-independent coproporphyrinogen-3 oxidase|nr:radical SAM family heme chaperone HemW [Tannerella sp.]